MMKKLISSLVLVSTVYGAAEKSPLPFACKKVSTFSPKNSSISTMIFSTPLLASETEPKEDVSLQFVFTNGAAAKDAFGKMQKFYPQRHPSLIIQQTRSLIDINAPIACLPLIEKIVDLMDLQPADKNELLVTIGGIGCEKPQKAPQSQFTTNYSYFYSQQYATLTLENEHVSEIKLTSPLSYWISNEITLEIFFKTQGKAMEYHHRLKPNKVVSDFQKVRTTLGAGKGLDITQKDSCVIIKTTSHNSDKQQLKELLIIDLKIDLKLSEEETKPLQQAIENA